jgi:universal stress protein E
MSQYQRILLIADPSMQRTPAFERAAWLAKTTGAALHIALFDRSATIAAMAMIDTSDAEQAREAWLQARRGWLAAEAMRLLERGIKCSVEAVWAHPVYEEILRHITEYQPDLVIKDVRHEALLKRLLLKPLDWHLLRDCPTPVLLVNSQAHAAPRRIVAAVDATQLTIEAEDFNRAVITAALALAIQCDAELHLASSFDCQMLGTDAYSGSPVVSPGLYETLSKLHDQGFAGIARANGVAPERAHSLVGPAPISLAEFAGSAASDVLVVGTHRRHGVDRLLMGSIAEAIVDSASCDVLVVKP